MKESKPYPRIEEEDGSCLKVSEAAVAFAESEVQEIPEDLDYANIIDGILQVTPDLEEEIAEVELLNPLVVLVMKDEEEDV